MMKRLSPSSLMVFGIALMALRATLQTVLDRLALTNDLSDFLLGAMFGAGAGMTLLGLWCQRRRFRPTPPQ